METTEVCGILDDGCRMSVVRWPESIRLFTDEWTVRGQGEVCSKPGDSGAWVFDEDGLFTVGMVFAGSLVGSVLHSYAMDNRRERVDTDGQAAIAQVQAQFDVLLGSQLDAGVSPSDAMLAIAFSPGSITQMNPRLAQASLRDTHPKHPNRHQGPNWTSPPGCSRRKVEEFPQVY